jgi:hypothetical protein
MIESQSRDHNRNITALSALHTCGEAVFFELEAFGTSNADYKTKLYSIEVPRASTDRMLSKFN